jgi:hypothetical protein
MVIIGREPRFVKSLADFQVSRPIRASPKNKIGDGATGQYLSYRGLKL